jgi:hypothetical protein
VGRREAGRPLYRQIWHKCLYETVHQPGAAHPFRNCSPILAELWELDQDLLGDFTEADLEATASAVRGDDAFMKRLLAAAVASETAWPKSKYVEFQIYDGFIQDWDEDVCRRFHAAPWNDRLALIDGFCWRPVARTCRSSSGPPPEATGLTPPIVQNAPIST